MSNSDKIWLPPMERLALVDLAIRRGIPEKELLAELIREAVKADLGRSQRLNRQGVTDAS